MAGSAMRRAAWALCWAAGAVAMVPCAQTAAVAGEAAAPQSMSATTSTSPATLRLEHIELDLTRGRLIVSSEVCLRQGQLELLLCLEQTKDYESILRTQAKPSDIHAAMLAMGLMPGLPVRRANADGTGPVLPPQGPGLRISLRWRDAGGTMREAPAACWLAARGNQAPPCEWVFVGSQILPQGAYQADLEGEIISVSNFPSSVIDVPFESTTANARLEYAANTDAIPAVGTKVDVVIEAVAGAAQSPYARAMVQIGPRGDLLADGQPVEAAALSQWAAALVAAHPKAQVVVRSSGLAMVGDLHEVRLQLRQAGVSDVREEVVPAPPAAVLRTEAHVRARLAWWQGRFANAAELVRDPAQAAGEEAVLAAQRSAELAQMRDLLGQYVERLNELTTKYCTSTRPASQP